MSEQKRRSLSEVKSWMTWWGWTHGGSPGSVRLDVDRFVIARHGDQIWQADVQAAVDGSTRPTAAHLAIGVHPPPQPEATK